MLSLGDPPWGQQGQQLHVQVYWQAEMQKQHYQLLTFLNWLLTIYITKALWIYQTQSRYDSNNEVPVDVKFVDFQSSFRFRWYQPFTAFFYDNNHFLIMFILIWLGRYLGTISSTFSQLRWVCEYIQGVFFNCSLPKNFKYQPVRNFWHLKLFMMRFYCVIQQKELLGGTV